jgi:hypothetical protein
MKPNRLAKSKLLACAGLIALSPQIGGAADINLFDYGFNIDGTVSLPTLGDPLPTGVNMAGFDIGTGLGSIIVTSSGAGARYVGLFVDHEIDEAINGFDNESGSVTGSAALGQSWEIDEPGFSFGDIFDNFQLGTLDNGNGVPAGSEDDVSMGLAWEFTLDPDEVGTINFLLTDVQPTSGFFLQHTDADSNASVYLSSSLRISGQPMPVPATLWLTAAGLIAVWGANSRRKRV